LVFLHFFIDFSKKKTFYFKVIFNELNDEIFKFFVFEILLLLLFFNYGKMFFLFLSLIDIDKFLKKNIMAHEKTLKIPQKQQDPTLQQSS